VAGCRDALSFLLIGRERVKSAVVIGAGLGGLGTGIHLARQGWDVTLLEQSARPGGRMNQVCQEGFRIDTGPTLLMMPEVLERIFADCGKDVREWLPMRRLDPSYQVRFADGTRLDMGDPAAMPARFAAFNQGDAERLPALLRDMERKYRLARGKFIERPFNSLGDLLNPTVISGFAQAAPVRSTWDYVSRWIKDPRLRQAFTFQTLYLGTSPFECPDIYGFLPYIEMQYGVWFPEGGMYSVAAALTRLLQELGGTVRCGTSVERVLVEGGRATGVVAGGEQIRADAVISNCDVQTTYTQLVPATHRRKNTDSRMWKRQSGCSGYLLYLGVKRKPADWPHHTVLLPDDYAGVMEDMFAKRSLPREPAVYACVPTATDPSLAPPDHHVLYILAPCPNLDSHINWAEAGPIFRRTCIDAVKRAGWSTLDDDIVFERQWTPNDFLSEYSLFRGSAFGLACTFWQSAYFRPHNRSEDVRNLYVVGASTHPGGGVPIVLTSARLVAEAVEQDWQRQPSRAGVRHPSLPRERATSIAE
jgi:phytoene desaturase